MVRAIGSSAEFDALISSKKPVLVKFCATWCGSCRRFVPTFEALATQYPGVEFVTVDVDGVQEVFNAQFAGCSRVSLPSFKHFKGGSEVGNFVSGADEAAIRKLLGGSGSGGGADLTPGDSARYFSDAHDGTYLGGYARYGARAYPTLLEAMKACLEDASAGGVTQEGPGKFTVRKGTQLGDSPSGEVSWVKTGKPSQPAPPLRPPPASAAPPVPAPKPPPVPAPKPPPVAPPKPVPVAPPKPPVVAPPKPAPPARLYPCRSRRCRAAGACAGDKAAAGEAACCRARAGACTAASAGACTAAGAVAQGEPLGALSCALLLLLPVQEGRRADEGRWWRAGPGCFRLRRRAVRAGAAAGAAGAARAVTLNFT